MNNGNHNKVCPTYLSESIQEKALRYAVHVSTIAGIRIWS